MAVTIELDRPPLLPDAFTRADLEFRGVDHSGPSFEARDQGDVLFDGEMRQEPDVLQHVSGAAPQADRIPLARVASVHAHEVHSTSVLRIRSRRSSRRSS